MCVCVCGVNVCYTYFCFLCKVGDPEDPIECCGEGGTSDVEEGDGDARASAATA